ncbi:MAG: FtsX-like permease family protein [Desulfobulbaceae bacterium]|nr:FtsX-like permease family protein [Desulfobulbaceae bacterium]HIJ79651.1 ABC transporter permease [Deltaproteobacteria bacterium]
MMVAAIAWRNIRANKKRSIVTVALISLTTALLVYSSAFMDGSHNKMIQAAVEIYPGYLQITQRDFRDNPSYDNLILDTGALHRLVEKTAGVAAHGARFETFVLYAAREKAVGAMLTGIEPEPEKLLSRLHSSLVKGRYLTKDDTNALYMGVELAKRLKVDVGDTLSFIGNGADYSFAADRVEVVGLFKTGLFDFDGGATFLNKPYFDQMMASTDLATHYVVLPRQPAAVEELAAGLRQQLSRDYRAESWRQTMGGLVEAMEVDSIFGYITLGIIFIVIFFVIMIYTLLTVFSRIREIGILRAIGTTPGQVLAMLLGESMILSLLSVCLGGLIGGALAYYFYLNPMEFPSYEEQFKQYGLAVTSMPCAFEPLTILRDMAIMFLLSLLSGLYPIVKVNRYQPVEAMHHV